MKRSNHTLAMLLCAPLLAALAYAGDAETSATATSNGTRSGTAAASASYKGNVGFARTDTKSGKINLARGVALGVDEHGLSLSLSTAVAGRLGPALATNFTFSLGTDGRVSSSVGTAVASGSPLRSVTAGGSTSSDRGGTSASLAKGTVGSGGVVKATTNSYASRPPIRIEPVRREPVRRAPVRIVIRHR